MSGSIGLNSPRAAGASTASTTTRAWIWRRSSKRTPLDRPVHLAHQRGSPASELEVAARLADRPGRPVGDHTEPVRGQYRRPPYEHGEQELEVAGIRAPASGREGSPRTAAGTRPRSPAARTRGPAGTPPSLGQPPSRASSVRGDTNLSSAARRTNRARSADERAPNPRIDFGDDDSCDQCAPSKNAPPPTNGRMSSLGMPTSRTNARKAGYAENATWNPRSTGPAFMPVRAGPAPRPGVSLDHTHRVPSARQPQAQPLIRPDRRPTTTTSTLMCSRSLMRRCYQPVPPGAIRSRGAPVGTGPTNSNAAAL